MGAWMRRLATTLGPPWVSEPEWLPGELELGRFTGLWAIVYVTPNWVVISSLTRDVELRLAEIDTIAAGFDPSPHDDGGPEWGIWVTMTSGREHGAGLLHPHEAAALIRSLIPTARTQKAEEETMRPPSPPDPAASGWGRR